MAVTIKDIAKKIGISYSSVSRALNDKPGVSDATKQQVLDTAEQMGYQPNELARGLVNKVSNSVGVIIPDILNPFFVEVIKGILEAAKDHKYNVFLCASDWNETTEREYYNTLRQKRVDGIILKPIGSSGSDVCAISDIPLIVIDAYDESACLNRVTVDNEEGGYLAAKYLLEKGKHNFAFVLGKEDKLTCKLRMKGVEKALSEAGISLKQERVAEESFSIEGGRLGAERLFSKGLKIDAVFGMNDLLALGVLQYCNESGRLVPEDVAVIGYDDISYAGLPQIQLTTIKQPKYELGRLLFETLLEEIKKGKRSEGDVIEKKLKPEIVIRKTT